MTTSKLTLKLLVVDDHPDIREMLLMVFKWRGHTVEAAESVAAALALAAKQPFDLVVADWSLPDGTGADLMRQLKARYQMKGIVLSAYPPEQIAAQSREAGFSRIVDKVMHMDLIVKHVEEVAGWPSDNQPVLFTHLGVHA